MKTGQTITEVKVYWDTQDPQREGWAYTVYGQDCVIDSGPLDDEPDDANPAELLVQVVWSLGYEITASDCGCEPNVGGGVAYWSPDA